MPETVNGYLENELATLEERFLTRVKAYLRGNLNQTEKIALFAELDFFQELQDAGLTKIISKVEKDYFGLIESISKNAIGGITAPTLNDLSVLVSLDAQSILRSAEAYSYQFKSTLIKGMVAGEGYKEIVKRLADLPLKTNNIIAAVTTAKDEFEATSLGKIFEDEPDTKFKLVGPLDARTRCECKAVLTNQPKSGWTKDEIDKGAATKIALANCSSYAERTAEGKARPYSFVIRGGFSCRHRWEIIE